MCSKFELLEAQYIYAMWHESINIFTDHTAILFQCHRYDSHLMMDHLHRGATSVSLERCTRTPFLRFHSTRRQHTSTSTIIHSANDTTSGYKKQSTIYHLFFYCPIVWCPFPVVGCWLLVVGCCAVLVGTWYLYRRRPLEQIQQHRLNCLVFQAFNFSTTICLLDCIVIFYSRQIWKFHLLIMEPSLSVPQGNESETGNLSCKIIPQCIYLSNGKMSNFI